MSLHFRFSIVVSLLLVNTLIADSRKHPNVVIILADDQGWGDLSAHGNSDLSTPHIDSLANDGVMLDRFYVCPVCSPTRAEFLTGRYHTRGGVFSTSTGGERLDLDEKTIADAFQAAGYATGAFGKWHNGMQAPYHPQSRGFDEYYGFCSGHWGNYFSPILEHNGSLTRGKGFIIDDLTDHAMNFMESNHDQPFFCYVPYCTPHSPMQVPDRFYEKFAEGELKMHNRDRKRENELHQRAALAMVENIDWNVGRILQKLDDLKLSDDTIVIYFSDNGPNGYRWNGDMKGRKGSTDEGGVRVPCFIRWPNHFKAGTKIEQITAAIDLLPTLASVCGVKIPSDRALDGMDISSLLDGSSSRWTDRMLFNHWRGRTSVRTQRFRLDNAGQLFDMQNDPGQRRPVNDDHPQITKSLTSAASNFNKTVAAELDPETPRPFPVGFAAETHLPARDGIGHGNIKRSARAPNCSFLTNWVSTDDSITWDVTVGKPGTFEATLYYSCPKGDEGSKVALTMGDSSLEFSINEPHDPPLTGAENDRSPRGSESYVKDFKPLSIGRITLASGTGQLTLRAVSKPGDTVADVRYLILKRVE